MNSHHDKNRPLLMGVLNVTPDSFSDGGRFLTPEDAATHFRTLLEAGADIIDVGAESTGPGSSATSAKQEIERLSVIFDLPERHSTCISVDTYRSETASYCLERGAQIVNDVSALRADKKMGNIVAEHKAAIVLMYSKQDGSQPNVVSHAQQYDDVIASVAEFFRERIDYAESCGIPPSNIILDPGMGGFISSDHSYSWEILRRLAELREEFRDYRMLIGTSRKGFLGGDVEERDPLSQLTSMVAFQRGADIIRSHNVTMAHEFCRAWNLLGLLSSRAGSTE